MTDFHVPPESDQARPAGTTSENPLDQYRNHGGQRDRLSYDIAGGGHFDLVKADPGDAVENPNRC